MRARVLDSVTPPLRRSAWVRKPHPVRQLAGTLVPNVLLPTGLRFDELADGRFVLITSTPLPGPALAELRERGAVALVAPPRSELSRWLRSGRAEGVVVRPDRYVMTAGPDVPSLCRLVPRFAEAAPVDGQRK
jgi:3-(3-hydroxy-phenyl)propionate hydroxylase